MHPNDIDDAVQYAFERLVKMPRSFKGTSEGEFRAAMRTCVRFACMDHSREMEEEKPIAGSLDETGDWRASRPAAGLTDLT